MSVYTAENYISDIAVADYIAGFRDEARFLDLCGQCGNYGCRWGCPPFDFDAEALLRKYKYARIVACKIIPSDRNLPIERTHEFLLPERTRLERELLEMERTGGGLALTFGGKCLYCEEEECARISGEPCRHPDKVRPSLEALGFDLSKTLAELFGIELRWSKDGLLPEYLVLVCGFFHDTPLAARSSAS